MFTAVISTGRWKGCPSASSGGHWSATLNRTKKYAVKSDPKSITSEPMKKIIASMPMRSWLPRETGGVRVPAGTASPCDDTGSP